MGMARLFYRQLAQGARVPAGWGRAWYEPGRRVGVYSPMPLHWILRLGRECACRVANAVTAPPIERAQQLAMRRREEQRQQMADEYSRGYLAGWRSCFEACLRAVEGEMEDANSVWEYGDWVAAPPGQREN